MANFLFDAYTLAPRSSELCMVNLETVFVFWIDLFVIVIAKGEDLLFIMCHGADTKEIAKFRFHFYEVWKMSNECRFDEINRRLNR